MAANLVNNANSNNNNNNNNNNDNNDNVNNINVANNNNAGNNVNDIQICPFPCLPQPPPVVVPGGRRLSRRMKMRSEDTVHVRSDEDDIKLVTLLLTDLVHRLQESDIVDKDIKIKKEQFLSRVSKFSEQITNLKIGKVGILLAEAVLNALLHNYFQ